MDRREHTRLLSTLKTPLPSTFIAAVLLFVLVGCSDYTSRERTLFGIMLAGQVADGLTTEYALDHGFKECNPILGERPSDGEIVLFKMASMGVFWLAGEIWPQQREMIFTIGGVSGWGAAGWNLYQIEK